MSDTNWNDVGDKIKDAVDSAISTGDFSNLSRSIGDVINDTIDNVKGSVKTAAQQNKKHTVQTHITKQYTQNRHRISHSLRHCTTNVRRSGRCDHQYGTGLFRGYFTLAGVISFIALSAAVSHMFLVPLIIFGILTVGGFCLVPEAPKKFVC